MTPLLAAVKRGFLKKCTSSIGWSMRLSHTKNDEQQERADDERGDDRAVAPAVDCGASMMP